MLERIKISYGKLISNVGLSFSAKIVAMIFYLLIDIVLVRVLSFAEYDEWCYFYAIAVICFSMVRLGINTSTKVHIAGENIIEEKTKYIQAGLIIRVFASVFFGFLSLLLLLFIEKLGYPYEYPNLNKLIMMLPVLIINYTLLDFFKEANVGLNKFKNIFILTVLEFGLCLVFTIILNYVGGTNIKVMWSYILGYAVATCIGFSLVGKNMFSIRIKVDNVKRCIKRIISFAFPMYMSNLVGSLLVEMDTFMLGLFNPGQTGVYAIAKNLVTKMTNLNLAICVGTMAQLAIVNSGNIKEQRRKINKVMKINLMLTAGVCVAIMIFGDLVISILYGREYIYAGTVIKCLLVYYICYATSIFPSTFISYQKQSEKILKNNLLMFVCNLIFNIMLIPKYGAIGAAVASALAILPYTFFMFKFQKEIMDTIELSSEID